MPKIILSLICFFLMEIVFGQQLPFSETWVVFPGIPEDVSESLSPPEFIVDASG